MDGHAASDDTSAVVAPPHSPPAPPPAKRPKRSRQRKKPAERIDEPGHDHEHSLTMSSTDEQERRRTVVVSGLPPTVREDEIEAYFQSTKHGARGDVEKVVLDKANFQALVTFDEEHDVWSVLELQHTLKGSLVRLHQLQVRVAPAHAHTSPPFHSHQQPAAPEQRGAPGWTAAHSEPAPAARGGPAPHHVPQEETERLEGQMRQQHEHAQWKAEQQRRWQQEQQQQQQGTGSDDHGRRTQAERVPEEVVSNMQPSSGQAAAHPDDGCVVVVTACDGELPDLYFVEMYFEARKKSGGGEIVKIDKLSSTVLHIQFEDAEDASRVCQKRHSAKGVELAVALLAPEPPADLEPPKTIVVSSLPDGCDEDLVEVYFDSRKRSGGGGVSGVEMSSDGTEAYVTFDSADVAAAVCARTHTLSKREVTVRLVAAGQTPHSQPACEPCLVVSGFNSSKVDQERLEMYFENTRKSGGDDIDELVYNEADCSATITFESPSVMHRVAGRTHLLAGSQLRVEVGSRTVGGGGLSSAACATADCEPCLVVSGFNSSKVDQERLEMYFENTRKSGGDDIDELVYNEADCSATITFESPSVMHRVAGRTHLLAGSQLRVEVGSRTVGGGGLSSAACATADVAGAAGAQFELDKVILLDIPAAANEDLIGFYLRAAFRGKMGKISIQPYPQNSRALVTFPERIDFELLANYVSTEILAGAKVSLRRVSRSSCLRLRNAADVGADEEFLRLVFKGDMGITVTVRASGSYVDVEFPSPECAAKALSAGLSARGHVLDLHPVVAGLDYPGEEDAVGGFDGGGGSSAGATFDLDVDAAQLLALQQCAAVRRGLQEALRAAHAGVESFEVPAPPLRVAPLEGKAGVFGWKHHAGRAAADFVRRVDSTTLTMLSDVYKEAVSSGKLKAALSRHLERVVLVARDDDSSVTLAGMEEAVVAARDATVELLQAVEATLREVVREHVKLRPFQRALLEHTGLVDAAGKDGPVSVVVVKNGKNKGSIAVEGPRTHAAAIVQRLMTSGQQVLEKQVGVQPPEVASLLASQLGQKYVAGLIRTHSKDLEACVFVVQPSSTATSAHQISLVGWNNDEQELAALQRKVEQGCSKEHVDLQQHEAEALACGDWQPLLAQAKKDYLVSVEHGSVRDRRLCLSGVTEHIVAVRRLIADFMLENAVLAAALPVTAGQERYIHRHLRQDVATIKAQHALPNVDVRDAQITFRGNVRNVEAALAAFRQLLAQVCGEQFTAAKHGIQHLFRKEDTKKAVKFIENAHAVVIQAGGALAAQEAAAAAAAGGAATGASPLDILVTGVAASGGRVKVMRGDITLHACDAVVNAANDRLEHVGGVAHALVRRGGQRIQDECKRHVQAHGLLAVGESVCTTAGALACQVLIHTVGPRYSGGYSGEDAQLRAAVDGCLRAAEQRRLATVAMPAISTGVFGYPLRDAAVVLLGAVMDHFERNGSGGSVKEVHFVDVAADVVDTFRTLVVENFPPSQIHFPQAAPPQAAGGGDGGSSRIRIAGGGWSGVPAGGNGGRDRGGASVSHPHSHQTRSRGKASGKSQHQGSQHQSSSRTTRGRKQQQRPSQPRFEAPPSGISQVTTREEKTIIVRQGDLCQEQADVIVNSAAASLDLNNGMVAKALLRAAGPALQAECQTYVQTNGDVPVGNFAATSGHGLSCQFIYHCVGGHFSQGDGSQSLQGMVEQCLVEADRQGLKSIVFPSLGTGNLGFAPTDAAQLMFNGALNFSRQHPSGTLTDIRFAIFDKKILDAFHEEAYKYIGVPGASAAAATAAEGDEDEDGDFGFLAAQSNASPLPPQQQQQQQTGPVFITNNSDVLCGAVANSNVQLHLFKGDISKEKADAVLVSVHGSLDLSRGPVSKKIAGIVGAGLQAECDRVTQRGPLAAGCVAVVGGGRFSTHLLLTVCPHGNAGHDALEDAVHRALQEADKRGAVTVAMPALGTGNLGFSFRDSAAVIVSAVSGFAPTARHLRCVRLVLFDERSMKPFQDEVNNELENVAIARDDSLFARGARLLSNIGLTAGSNPSVSPLMATAAASSSRGGRSAEDEEPLVLNIYGSSRSSVSGARKDLASLCDKKHRTKEVKSAAVALSPRDIEQIETFGETIGVHLRMQGDRIIISGENLAVSDANGQILEVIAAAAQRDQQLKHAATVAKQFQWTFRKPTSTVEQNYELLDNMQIEDAFQSGAQFAKIAGPVRRAIDFRNMKETTNQTISADVTRNDLTKAQVIPKHWDLSKGAVVALPASDLYYKKVEQLFRKTSQRTIVKIERIQSQSLYAQYQTKKIQMDNEPLSQSKSNELRLFHGTDNATVQKVVAQGFNRSFAGKNATVYGRGVYFARDANYSERYSQGAPLQMFQVLVLAGDYAVGNQQMIAPPNRPNRTVELLDSTVDNIGNPSIYVTYHDAQVYPEYLITFQ